MKLRKCVKCKRYTLKELCPLCGANTISAHPPKFSPEDKYGKWRRKVKFGSENSQT
ncbi:MAG TPA: RNA-protein complex protein Nop10 [Nanoarchaeota archaeon]|nr:RNA-protein complex protein Nop10 [Nanoarchaeota archaeon]